MKKFILLCAGAVLGLSGLNVHASLPPGYESVNAKLVVLTQGDDTVKGSTTHYNVTKVKVTNQDLLNLIEDEFSTNFPDGAQLVSYGIWSDEFAVLDKDGNVLLADASENENVSDDYSLYMYVDDSVYTGEDSDTTTVYNYTALSYLYYKDATDANSFYMGGASKAKDSYKQNSDNNWTESYQITGMYDGTLNDATVLVTGKISGSGKGIILL